MQSDGGGENERHCGGGRVEGGTREGAWARGKSGGDAGAEEGRQAPGAAIDFDKLSREILERLEHVDRRLRGDHLRPQAVGDSLCVGLGTGAARGYGCEREGGERGDGEAGTGPRVEGTAVEGVKSPVGRHLLFQQSAEIALRSRCELTKAERARARM